MPSMRDNVIVMNSRQFSYMENGISLLLDFVGLEEDIPQCTIESDTTTPLTGEDPVTFTGTTDRDYGTNLFYQPIPMDFLYTAETQPQLMVSVNSLPVICASLDCNYAYVESTAEVTQTTIIGTTVTITGTGLPTTFNRRRRRLSTMSSNDSI